MTGETPNARLNWVGGMIAAIGHLEAKQLMSLALQYEGDGPMFPLSATQLQRSLGLSTTDAIQLSRNLERVAGFREVTARDMRVVLTTLTEARSSRTLEERVEVVCTAPSDLGVPVRATFAAGLEMVRAASSEVLVVGYVRIVRSV